MKRRILVALLIASIMFLSVSCSKNNQASKDTSITATSAPAQKTVQTVEALSIDNTADATESVEAEVVNMALGYDLTDLAPWSSATAGRNSVFQMLYEFMGYYDPLSENGVSGILMKSYERTDGYTARVEIYDYIYDSAGNHLTAEDIAFSFNSWKASGKSVKCKLLSSCTVVDDYTVEIKLTKNTVGDLENMLCGLVPIVSKTAYENSGDGMISSVVSTSPYRISDFVSGSHITIEKRDDYWQTDESLIQPVSRANAKTITYKVITEAFQVPISLETGDIDISCQLSYTDASRFMEGGSSSKGFKTYGIKDVNFYWLTFNCGPGGLFENNQALRQAVAYAIDVDGLIKGVLNGGGERQHAYANSVCVDYNPEWNNEPYYEYDTEKASVLLKDSGFNTSVPVRILVPNATVAKNTAQVIQSYLLQIGLKCELRVFDSALFQTYKTDPDEWDIMIDSKMSNDYVTSLASTFEVSGAAKAINFVQDDKLQSIVSEVQTGEGHTPEKIDEYMDYLRDQCYIYALFVPYQYYVTVDTISGIFTNFKSYLIPSACTYSEAFNK